MSESAVEEETDVKVEQEAPADLRLIDLIDALSDGKDIYFEYVQSAKDIMAGPVEKLTLDNNVKDALELMTLKKIRHLPLVDIDEDTGVETFLGIISQRDVARQVSKGLGTSGEASTDEQALSGSLGSIVTRGPETAQTDTPIFTIIQLMLDKKFDCVPVTDEDNNLLGMITTTDILATYQRIDMLGKMSGGAPGKVKKKARLIDLKASKTEMGAQALIDTHLRTVGDLMTDEVLTVTPKAPLKDAMELMQKNEFRHVVVVDDDNKIKGIVSDRDVLHALPPAAERGPSAPGEVPAFREVLFQCDESAEELNSEVRLCMTGEGKLKTMKADDLATDAINILIKDKIGAMPIVNDDEEVVGIVTTTDFLRGIGVLGQMLGLV